MTRRTRIAAICAGTLVLALIVRFSFANAATLLDADPWRHMALVRNLRDGNGFTLFADQAYIWYSPVWYHLAAALVEPLQLKWLSAAVSALAVPVFALYLYRVGDGDWKAAAAGGLLMVFFGPLVMFTGQLGGEALAILLLVSALCVGASGSGVRSGLISGLLFGLSVGVRLQFALDVLLFLPLLRKKTRGVAFAVAAALPVAAHWVRNWYVIREHPFVFTWDGMATRASDYGPISTLVVQLHPSVAEATRRLYEQILEWPEWVYSDGRFRWEIGLFFALAAGCTIVSKRLPVILTIAATCVYMIAFDNTHSSWFFRIWLGLLPALFIAIAFAVSGLSNSPSRLRRAIAVCVLIAAVLCGAPYLKPRTMVRLRAVTPPKELLTEERYMVSSGFFQPESLVFRYPGQSFIGMPYEAEQFDEFRKHFPEYRAILWHGFNVQTDLLEHVRTSAEFVPANTGRNRAGHTYELWKER